MHLLFADSVADLTIAELELRGHRCFVEPALTTAELPARIAGVDGLVVRSTKVDRAVFDAAVDVEVVGVGLLHPELRGGEQKDEHRHGDGECLDRADG